jgi:hypothetical protein
MVEILVILLWTLNTSLQQAVVTVLDTPICGNVTSP